MATDRMGRRPLTTRATAWARAAAQRLARMGLTPNQISLIGLLFAALAGLALLLVPGAGRGWRIALFLLAALAIQLRLACNMLDGMVAIEHRKKSKTGDVFNDLPDRLADLLVLVPAGYALAAPYVGVSGLRRSARWAALRVSARVLGWAAGAFAVLTAYVRVLAGAVGATPRYTGPMAKQHRMFVMTLGCLGAALELAAGWPPRALRLALWVVILGSVVTVARRTWDLLQELETR